MSSNWHILIVEDEPDGQEVAAGLLEHFGVSSSQVGNAEEALLLLTEAPFTAALIDLALPGMDGFSLLEAIRSDPMMANLPCIAVTAYHSSLVRQQAMEAGFDAYFPKPLHDSSLFSELDRVIAAE
jgi:two-component system cell cycle response regulator